MKFKVVAEMRASFEVGTFDAESAEAAMQMAQDTDRYYQLRMMPGMGGVYDLHAIDDDALQPNG